MAFVGVGHELRGDDAAGVAAIRALRAQLPQSSERLLVDAGSAPENCTGLLRRFSPDVVVFIDAAQMNEPPGTVRWLALADTSGLSASTHTLPLYVLAQYLVAELDCEIGLIGIQPANTMAGAALSPPVQASVTALVSELVPVMTLCQLICA